MLSCWALAHGCYVVQVNAKVSWINHELESSGGEVYIVTCSSATAEGKYRDRALNLYFSIRVATGCIKLLKIVNGLLNPVFGIPCTKGLF